MLKLISHVVDAILLAVLLLGGLYALCVSMQMLHWTALRPKCFIYPRNCLPASCEDPEGYRTFLQPRLFLFGVLFLLSAASFLCGNYIPACPGWLQWFALGFGLIGFILYKVDLRLCNLRYW